MTDSRNVARKKSPPVRRLTVYIPPSIGDELDMAGVRVKRDKSDIATEAIALWLAGSPSKGAESAAAEAYRAAAERVRTLEAAAKDLRERRERVLSDLRDAHTDYDEAKRRHVLAAEPGPVPYPGTNSELER